MSCNIVTDIEGHFPTSDIRPSIRVMISQVAPSISYYNDIMMMIEDPTFKFRVDIEGRQGSRWHRRYDSEFALPGRPPPIMMLSASRDGA
jgi:hypothetical protein